MSVLILEDQLMIGYALRDTLQSLGFETVGPYGNLEAAFTALHSERVKFALLDVNLGAGKTSEPFAEKLLELSIPFVFVTGYGSAAPLAEKFRDFELFRKPVRPEDLLNAIGTIN